MVKPKRFVICTSELRDTFSFHPKLISAIQSQKGHPYMYSVLSSRLLLPGTQEIEFYFLGGKRKSLIFKGQFWCISQSSSCKCLKVLAAQSCLTPCNPVDCNPPGCSVHGVLQGRILKWVTISFSKGSERKFCRERSLWYRKGIDSALNSTSGSSQVLLLVHEGHSVQNKQFLPCF